MAQMKCYKTMQPCFQRNTEILTSRILTDDEIPTINALYFRFESFGDIINTTQVSNYFNICKRNPKVKFALWTKNPAIVQRTINNGNAKPKNLQIVLSSHYINKQEDASRWSFIDKVFTVYGKDYVKENNINVNCGAKSCLLCNKCYRKDSDMFINEELKKRG